MNNLAKKLKGVFPRNKRINLVLTIVILFEVLALCFATTYAWVETVSSIKITNEANTTGSIINDTKYTDMTIGGETGTINLLDYFEPSGKMHLAPASSADGKSFYFPKTDGSVYRKGNVSDKNTTYLSVTFRLKADENADFFFWKDSTHNITVHNDIRVSVTSQSEGSTSAPVTTIYANNASSAPVVNSTSGATGATTVEAFSDHVKGKSSTARLFAVGANETKIVTINVWLQNNNSLTSNMSVSHTIQNLGITSSLTPRHVTLLPTPTWDCDDATFYAWCWDAPNNNKSRLYKLALDSESEHYYFEYNGTYRKTTFVRAVPNCTVQPGEYDSWPFSNNSNANTNGYLNQTVDTSIPNDPVDPTYIIETINGGTDSKSTGSWHDPATVKVATCTGQSTWGSLTATSYIGTTTSTHVLEATNADSSKHKDTVHAWPGKKLQLEARANTNYAFVGWYNNAEGTGNALSTSSTYTPDAPSTATEITYYAKFKEIRTLTIYRYLDSNNVSTACGTISIGGTNSTSGTSASKTVDKGSTVTYMASAATGYTLEGIYTLPSDGTSVYAPGAAASSITLDSNTNYYARFTTNSYNVVTHACYSTNNGSSYTTDDSTGGTVKTGSANAGATSTASVKYKSSANLVATPASGYEFVGWYDAATGGNQLSTNTTYSYTLSTVGDKDIYARFIGETWELKYGVHGASNWNSAGMTVSGNNVTGTLTLTEGQDFSFKLCKTIGSTNTWYGANNASYENITSTSFISNLTLSTSGDDIYMKGHAGTYTFTFDKSTNKLNVTASYSNITITFDYSSESWWGNDNAVISFYDGSGEDNMSNVANQTKKTLSISSTRGNSGNVGFNRWNNASHSTFWNNEDAGARGYSTTYKIGTGWQ